jgi:hypothetical protein
VLREQGKFFLALAGEGQQIFSEIKGVVILSGAGALVALLYISRESQARGCRGIKKLFLT